MWVPLRLLSLLLAAQCATATVAQRKPAPRPTTAVQPNVILITLDTTRADRMGFLGSQRGLTPNLDSLARDSVVFPRAYSQAPLTTSSHAAILSGTYPQFNHVTEFGVTLGDNLPYLPAILQSRGYRTAAFVAAVVLDAKNKSAPGFDRGFDVYDAGFRIRAPGQDRYKTLERRADDVVTRALAWLNRRPAGPFFLWVHLYDAHAPYDPPEPYKSRYASQPYDGEIAYEDAAVGKLLAQLRTKGLYNNTLLAVMADHGEAFGEHGEFMHGVFLYDETIHVPLLFKMPKQQFAGAQVQTRAVLVDVLPTILQSVGVAVPAAVQGESLIPEMTAEGGKQPSLTDHPAYAETDYPYYVFGWSSLRAWRTGKYLFVEAPKKELYDQSSDPNAEHNLALDSKAVADTLASQLDSFRQNTSSASDVQRAEADPELEEKLSALGYVSSRGGSAKGDALQTGPDPKDKVEISNKLYQGLLAVEDAQYQDAIPVLEEVIAKQPNVASAYVALGTSWARLKEYDKAIPPLRRALELRDAPAMTHYELAMALSQTGDWEGSVPEFEAAAKKLPKRAELHFSLAAAYARVNRMSDARKELETTLQLEPDNLRANLVLGRMLSLEGDPGAGLPRLKKAVALNPKLPDAHLFLADAYKRLGQKANAARERAEAERLRASGGQ